MQLSLQHSEKATPFYNCLTSLFPNIKVPVLDLVFYVVIPLFQADFMAPVHLEVQKPDIRNQTFGKRGESRLSRGYNVCTCTLTRHIDPILHWYLLGGQFEAWSNPPALVLVQFKKYIKYLCMFSWDSWFKHLNKKKKTWSRWPALTGPAAPGRLALLFK